MVSPGAYYENIYIFFLFLSVREKIGPIATPDYIQYAPSLPKTRSGKGPRDGAGEDSVVPASGRTTAINRLSRATHIQGEQPWGSRMPQVWALPNPAEDAEETLTPALLSWLSLQERLPDGY